MLDVKKTVARSLDRDVALMTHDIIGVTLARSVQRGMFRRSDFRWEFVGSFCPCVDGGAGGIGGDERKPDGRHIGG